MEARVDALEKKVEELKMGKLHVKKEKGTRKPSPYNNFMSSELAKLGISHPELSHREKFKLAASRYGAAKKSSE
jgi:hypothetical protein